MFSRRFTSIQRKNQLTLLLEKKRKAGATVIDLTESNPTRAGLCYPQSEILAALADPRLLDYQPTPVGLEEARQAVAEYYHERGSKEVSTGDILLTASTSEAYSYLFKLLADPGDALLAPEPSYPLFDFLAAAESLQIQPYPLVYENGWKIDVEELVSQITSRTRAVILVNPNNPTGSFVKQEEWKKLSGICAIKQIPVICDEVFFDYVLDDRLERFDATSGSKVLAFALNGLSKVCGLPQMKLSWIVLAGPEDQRLEALQRLEIISDTFLSVSTPIQYAATHLLRCRSELHAQILNRIRHNLTELKGSLLGSSAEVLKVEGGWYAILRVPEVGTEEGWALQLLNDYDLLIHPGYFYDFRSGAFLVLSLLTDSKAILDGIGRIKEALRHL